MFQLLLVDDRQDIVKRISKSIDWESMDITLFTAYNGQDAFELMQRTQIDILVTDIKMPFLSGIELINMCVQQKYRCKFILISGYDDFKYAKQAIRLSVSDYLLKPIQVEDLVNSIETVKAQIIVENQLETSLNEMRSHEHRLASISKNDMFENIISKDMPIDPDTFAQLDFNINPHDVYCIVVQIPYLDSILEHGGTKELHLIKYALTNIAKEVLANDFLCDDFSVRKDRSIFILSAKNRLRELQVQYKLYELSEVIQNIFHEHFKLNLAIAISEHYTGGNAVKQSFTACKNMLNDTYQTADAALLLESEWKDAPTPAPYPCQYEKLISQSLCFGERDKIIDATNALCDYIESGESHSKTHHIAQLCKLTTAVFSAQGQECEIAQVANQLQGITYFSELRQYLQGLATSLCNAKEKESPVHSIDQEMHRVKAYLEEHYQQNITLKEIAETLHVSQSYLSTLFKEVVGTNFNVYLTNIRIEHAKELLQSNQYKIYEIAERVGYQDAKYFSEIFRKATGALPKEWYKNNHTGEG